MKKLIPIVAASVVTGVALFSFAACSSPANSDASQPATTMSASATPSPTTSASASKPASPGTADSSDSKVRVSPPNALNISDVTTNSLKAAWVSPDNTVGKVTQYILTLKENGAETGTVETTEMSYVFSGLKSNTAYAVEVRAVAVSANGANKATSVPAISNTVVVRSPEVAETPANSPSPASTPSPTATVDAEAGKIVTVLTGFYNFVGSPDNLAKVKEAGKDYESNPSDTELKKMVTNFPEGFKYFDTSTSQSMSDSYNQLIARTTQSNRTGETVKVTVPVEAVTVKDGKATVDTAKLKVESKGKTANGTEAPYFENPQMSFVQKTDGSWVMIPEPPRHTIP